MEVAQKIAISKIAWRGALHFPLAIQWNLDTEYNDVVRQQKKYRYS